MSKFIGLAGRRKRWALRQRELAFLIGVNPTNVSRYESGTTGVSVRTLLALQVVFGAPTSRLIPHAYTKVQDQVMRRAARLDRALASKTDRASVRKRALLSQMARRGNTANTA